MQIEDQGLKHTVPKLAADSSNWVIYHDRLLWVLDTNILGDHIQSSSVPLLYTTAGTINGLTAEQRWMKEEGMVKQFIGATIPDITFNCVKGNTSANDVWAALKRMYKERTKILMVEMMRHFRNKHCNNSESVRTHFEELSQLHEQLAAMGKDI